MRGQHIRFTGRVVEFYHSAGKNLPKNCRFVDHMVAIALIPTDVVTRKCYKLGLKSTFPANVTV
jgi:hypothetical protein